MAIQWGFGSGGFYNDSSYSYLDPSITEDGSGGGFWDVQASDLLSAFGSIWSSYWDAQTGTSTGGVSGGGTVQGGGSGLVGLAVLLAVAALLFFTLRQ